MLKIILEENPVGTATLYLEGQIIGPWIEELERACEPILASGSRLSLDLSSVSFLSREGVRLIWKLCGERVRLLHCSAFVTEQLKSSEEPGP